MFWYRWYHPGISGERTDDVNVYHPIATVDPSGTYPGGHDPGQSLCEYTTGGGGG